MSSHGEIGQAARPVNGCDCTPFSGDIAMVGSTIMAASSLRPRGAGTGQTSKISPAHGRGVAHRASKLTVSRLFGVASAYQVL